MQGKLFKPSTMKILNAQNYTLLREDSLVFYIYATTS